MASLTVFVVDDQAVFRDAATAVIDATDGVIGAGVSGDGSEALAHLLDVAVLPDLILMDVHLGDNDGIALTKTLVEARPDARVVLFSTMSAEDLSVAAQGCGATGYIPKAQLSPTTLRSSLFEANEPR